MSIPAVIRSLIVKFLAGDLDENYFDKTCFVHNDSGAFIGWIAYTSDRTTTYRITSFHCCESEYFLREREYNILACKAFKSPYGRSRRDKDGYDMAGYDIFGYDVWGYDKNRYDVSGYDRFGYDVWGYDIWGYDKNGYNSSGYDIMGYDKNGNNIECDGIE